MLCLHFHPSFLSHFSCLQKQIFSGETQFSLFFRNQTESTKKNNEMNYSFHQWERCIKLFLTQPLLFYTRLHTRTHYTTLLCHARTHNGVPPCAWTEHGNVNLAFVSLWLLIFSLFFLRIFPSLRSAFFLFKWFGIILIINLMRR